MYSVVYVSLDEKTKTLVHKTLHKNNDLHECLFFIKNHPDSQDLFVMDRYGMFVGSLDDYSVKYFS